MGYGSDSGSQDGKDEDDEDDYEETGGSNRLLGFMFGNVDNSGDLDVDYLDEDAKEHLSALADKLGSSLTDINLSVKSSHRSSDIVEDYDEKAEDAVDYEDIDEQYEGPEVQAVGEEDYLLPKKDYLASEVSLATLKPTTSVFDDEDYDEEVEEQNETVNNASDVQTTILSGEQIPEADSGGEKRFEDDHRNGSSDAETSNSDVEEFEGDSSDKSSAPLPVLCMEDGKAILRFTELFGIKDHVRKREKREHKSAPRASYKAADVFNNVEDDEEEFFTGSGQGFISLKREDFDKYEHEVSVFHDDESDSEKSGVLQGIYSNASKDICCPAEPMKRDLDHSIGKLSPLSPAIYPLDQLDWEDGIVWDNSPSVSENYKISSPDTEASVDSEAEPETPQSPVSEPKVEPGNKSHDKFLYNSPVILEQFGSRSLLGPSSLPFSEGRYHPQLLRLESRSEVDNSDQDDGRTEKVAERKLHRADAIEKYSKLVSQNRDMNDGSWLDDIIWDQSRPVRKAKLILDLQDEQMLFEILDNEDGKNLMLHAGAMFTTRSIKSSNGDSLELSGHVGQSGWRSVANDKHYSSRKTSQQMKANSKKRTTQGVKIYHSQPALTLQTMKLKLSNKDLANFHRPRALWYPHDNEVAVKELAKLSTRGPMKVIIKSLNGKGIKLHVDAEETVSSVKAKASKKLEFKPFEPVKFFYLGKQLEDDKTLSAQSVQPNSLLHLVRTKIHLLPRAQKLPGENKSRRPPGAFKKKSDLSVKDGHVFLMEYCEERPLLLSNIGMGARLCTYYQKSTQDDQTASLLRSTDNTLGHVIALNPADKSPFLGDIKPGSSQSSLETNMYRAPVFSHKVPSTDYLLIRSPKGKISLRRIDRLNVVGQQEPLVEVMSPGSKNLQNYMMNRLLVHVCHTFRAAEKNESLPSIRGDEFALQFPYLSDISIRKKLKEFAHFQRVVNAQYMWVKKRGFRMFTEDELRNIVKPEEVCAYDSMQAGLYRLKHLGITETHPNAVLSSMNRLPDEALALAAASHIERELLITPWNLSSNFVASTQGKENIERMEITGVGDPTGRGLGFSYVRVVTKAPVTNAAAKKKAAGAGRVGTTVTGTDADLRRLSMEAARELLLKFDVQDEVIAKLGRWHRIAMIRKLSSEQAEMGVKVDPSTISKYARGQRMSFLQLQHQAREKCLEIWDRQVQSLAAFDGDENESESEGNNSDLDSFAGDLENLLDAEECEDEEEGNFDSSHDKSDGVKGLKMRKRPTLIQAEEELEDEAAEANELCRLLMDDDETLKKKKKKAKGVGEESGFTPASRPNFGFENTDRLKQISFANHPVGSYVTKENIIGESKVEIILKKNKPPKIKPKIKNEVIPTVTLTNTKIKIAGEVKNQIFKEKKSARESFICGACGQLGHMRTNKNCPKYGDPDAHAETPDPEKVTGKATPFGQTQVKTVTKKLIPKGATKIALVETSDGENYTTAAKVVPLKFKCGTTDKAADKYPQGATRSSDQPATSDSETGKSAVKINKIIISNKLKHEDQKVEAYKPPIVIRPPAEIDRIQIETQKPTIVIRPPANLERDRFEPLKIPKQATREMDREKPKKKKIIIKRPKETIDLDPFGGDGGEWSGGIEHRKTKRMVELSGFEFHRKPEKSPFAAEGSNKAKAKEKRKWFEEQERQRNEERERRAREERMRAAEEQEKLDEIRRYEVSLRREREEEERMKAQKKKKKKRPVEMRDDYFDDSAPWRFDKRVPERDRTVKRRPVVDHGRSSSDFGALAKRRRGGEVGLANILEHIVETLKERKEVSYLFMKPVTKKEAPDYLRVIDRPMDLSTIKEKVRKMEYKSREQFRHDVWQIAYNAHRYNDGRNPGIPPLADQLLEICDYLLNENDESLTEAEAGIESRDF